MKKNVKILANVILAVVIVFCVVKIGYRCIGYYRNIKSYFEIQALKPKIEHNAKINAAEEKLRKINPDYKFWISIPDTDIGYFGMNIPNTDISYPVVQRKDNEFYLSNNFYRQKSASGSIFVENNDEHDAGRDMIIYGHNMKSSTMFNKINNFKEEENFKKGIVKIIKDNKEYTYEVFSVFVVDEKKNELRTNFASDEEYMKYIDFLKQRSIYHKNIKNNDFKRILTLYTCSYEFDGARTIVCAVLK
ncbi:MAG: class B sortase [Clostridium sp.]|jgi:sortase B|uniref:class B sortase n=1 Tax=Clostridium sp. TaxID=1506 RepID=UPI0025C6B693|nr:class B sortase [Clostridium sp.]MCH3965075.1 class B sortase [Clostridium sp.]MCI1714296.1 class B sortase [Clostridium sp.]MCI1798558.1 class B sortase [Clostridium sp.]MCI1812711.1 class B sortase [Clostridium sp.]MCI1869367.1 class B sortase [Clostridium sp.]